MLTPSQLAPESSACACMREPLPGDYLDNLSPYCLHSAPGSGRGCVCPEVGVLFLEDRYAMDQACPSPKLPGVPNVSGLAAPHLLPSPGRSLCPLLNSALPILAPGHHLPSLYLCVWLASFPQGEASNPVCPRVPWGQQVHIHPMCVE